MQESWFPERMPRDVVALLGAGLALLTIQEVADTRWGADSHAYWAAWRGPMYDHAPNTLDAFLYSPAFAQAIWPLAHLPWPIFGLLWSLVAAGTLVYLFRPLGWPWVLPLLLCCTPELFTGNVFWLLALVVALGSRWPVLWTIPVLTKILPGIGLLWFAVRREWRSLAIATAATVVLAAVSLAVDPHLWRQWYEMLSTNASSGATTVGSTLMPPLTYRLPAAVVLVVWAAKTHRRWGLPAAVALVTPVTGISAFVVLAALPRLYRSDATSPAHVDRRDVVGSLH